MKKENIRLFGTKNNRIKVLAWLLCGCLLIAMGLPLVTDAATRNYAENVKMILEEGSAVTVRALYVSSARELYVSLKDMASLMRKSEKAFDLQVGKEKVAVNKDKAYAEGMLEAFTEEELDAEYWYSPKAGCLEIDGEMSGYSCIIASIGSVSDCYMSVTDFAMMTNTYLSFDGEWHFDSEKDFTISFGDLLENDYLEGIDAALIGDASTGEMYFEYKGDEKVEIASTTKLLTYLVIQDAVRDGIISVSDTIEISENAAALSQTEDGVIKYEAGQMVDYEDLIKAILLPSSNESALALAEHTYGSEEAFVEVMRKKLESLGIYDGQIYNCHGLPIYSNDLVASKNQNRLSAEDMFKIVCCIIENYPEVVAITDLQEAHLDSLGQFVKNTNGLLKNIPEVNGLKTGTTNKAGACLVATCEAKMPDGKPHTLVAMEFGAENNAARIEYGEVLIRLAMAEFGKADHQTEEVLIVLEPEPMKNADKLIWTIMHNAKKKGMLAQ